MKPQPPKSKLQRNSKPQTPRTTYLSVSGAAWVLNDELTANNEPGHPFDLEERTAKFGEAIIRFSKKIPRGPGNDRLIDQLVGCGTSIGANYSEPSERVSKRDFTHSISRCAKEAKETKFFLRMVAAGQPELAEEARVLYREGDELHLIFAKIFRKGRGYSK